MDPTVPIIQRRLAFVILSAFLLMLPFARQIYAQKSISPIRDVDQSNVQIVDNTFFCFAGYGTKQFVFSINGEKIKDDHVESFIIPSTDLSQSPYTNIGCSFDEVYLRYSYHDYSLKLEKTVDYKGGEYNLITYSHNSVSVGYKLPLISHLLFLGAGIGYEQTQYSLGFYSKGNNSESEEMIDSSATVALTLEVYFSSFVFVEWSLSKSFSNDTIIDQSNQLGLSFYIKL